MDEGVPLRDSLLVVAFPTLANVACTAARFLLERLDLPRVGTIYSPDLPPVATLRHGRPSGPVEIYAGTQACGLDGVCQGLAVVTTDAAIEDNLAHDLAMALLKWSRDIGSGEIAVLEAVRQTSDGAAPAVMGAASTDAAIERLETHGIPLVEQGILRGVPAVLLHRGAAWNVAVYALVAAAHAEPTDASAANRLIQEMDRVLVRSGIARDLQDEAVEMLQEDVMQRRLAASPSVDIAYL